MSKVFKQLARERFKFFNINYSSEYKTFIPNHVIIDPSHPLHTTQKRRARARKKEGLWWHATTGVDLAKSSCVRSWARRRLRQAIIEELKARGYDENGKVIDRAPAKYGEDLRTTKDFVKPLDLKGSLKLHVQVPLLPAKFVDVKAEAGKVVQLVVEGTRAEADSLKTESTKQSSGRQQWNPPTKQPSGRPQWNPPSEAAKKPWPSLLRKVE
jgi:hypothetical protein